MGAPVTPEGGSFWRRLKSLRSRRLALVLIFKTGILLDYWIRAAFVGLCLQLGSERREFLNELLI